VIEYKFKWQKHTEEYRLVTTILNHEDAPAEDLAALYHERWEVETALAEVKTQMRGPRIALRSKTPELVRQEFYAFLLAYFAVRGVMHEAALQADEDPDRLSFRHAIKVIRRKLPAFGIFPPAAMA
jgi:IS4 transposase